MLTHPLVHWTALSINQVYFELAKETMASVDVTQLTDDEKATISQVMNVAQTLLDCDDNSNNVSTNGSKLATVAGAMQNSQGRAGRPITLNKTLDGYGPFVVEPTATIGGNGSGAFVQRAPSFSIPHLPGGHGGGIGPVIIGCKAAVIYGTFDKALPQLGYLLAWFKSQSSDELKVHVEAGSLGDLMNKEWSEIDDKLNASGTSSRSVDSVTGAVAAAEIKDIGNNLALLGASFERVPLDA